ncbi:MAG: glycosyltransferase, partial [Saprospiraceae bacterium]|nr:glycosyltransferase [Saprospiraceae bacterium]
VVRQIVQWQAKHCEWVGVYTTGPIDLLPPNNVFVEAADLDEAYRSWRYPVDGLAGLLRVIEANGVTVLHLHGLWRAASLLGVKAAIASGVPAVLSVHGQTSPWALNGQGVLKWFKKWLYWTCFARGQFKKLKTLHAITPLEGEHMARFFKSDGYVVIPNAIDLDSPEQGLSAETLPTRSFVFLGRLHPVKGVDTLIDAFSSADLGQKDWRLLLAGPEEVPEYVKHLRELATRSKRGASIDFIGTVFKQDKQTLLRQAWALVAPSHTEVIGMVNLEAAAQGTPSLTTHQTGLSDWQDGGGVLIDPEVDSLRTALENASRWSMEERLKRGQASRELVEKRYSQEAVGPLWIDLYNKLQGGVK